MALWSNVDEAAGKPKNLSTAEKTVTFGVDTAEVAAERSQGTPVTHAGWVLRTEGTGGRAGRVFHETLVAMGSMSSDLEDTKIQDLNIVIGTQPSNSSAASGSAVTFTVAASTVPAGGTLGYQWQISEDAGATWANVSNAGVYTTATTATLNISDNTGLDGNQYRAKVTATGADLVYSTVVTLTETA
jgi:hypothetical protein